MKTVNLKQNSENENENELSSVKLKRLKKKVKKNYWHWKYYGSIKVSRKENDEIEYSGKTPSYPRDVKLKKRCSWILRENTLSG